MSLFQDGTSADEATASRGAAREGVRPSALALPSEQEEDDAPVPAPSQELVEKFLHILLADRAKEAAVMGRNARLLASRVAGEAIADSDIDVPCFFCKL